MIGTTVGKYRILEKLGRGGMGTVYKALDETLDRVVAIKVLNPDLGDAELLKRFRTEAISLARLNHPGIATIYELHRHNDDLLMVMEFLRGETLQRLSERLGPLDPPQAAHICIQILDALAHAHRAGVIHRDLKPANVMVTDSGMIKVMDFGIARMLGGEQLTHTGYMMGTPAYMAPEQVLGKEIDGRADLYSVGVLFYRLLSRELPFKADTAIGMAQKQVAEPPTPISTFRPDLPAWCESLITKALAKAPADRFQTPEAFRAALTAAVTPANLGDLPTMATPTGLDLTLPKANAALLASQGTTQNASATAVTGPPLQDASVTPPPGSTTGSSAAPAPVERTGASVVLGRTHLFTLAALLVVLIGGLVVLGFLALKRGGATETAGSPPVEAAADPAGAATQPEQQPSSPPATPESLPSAAPAAPDPATQAPAAGAGTTAPASSASAPTSGVATAPGTTKKPKPVPKPAEAVAAPAEPVAAPPPEPPAPPPPAPEVAPITFKDVKVLVAQGNSRRERDAVLTLAGDHLSVTDGSGKTQIMTVPYDSIGQAFYSRSKEPKWKGPDGKERGVDVDLGKLSFFRGDRNWLILTTTGEPVFLRFEDAALRAAMAAVQERIGVKILR